MANNKKNFKPVDPMGSMLGALSKATNALSEIENTFSSSCYYSNNLTTVGDYYNITNPLVWRTPDQGIGVGLGTETIQTTGFIQPYDTGGYPKIDIVVDTMSQPQKLLPENPLPDIPAWRIDIYLAGVSKENVHLKLDEASSFKNTIHPPTLTITIDKVNSDAPTSHYFLKESKKTAAYRLLTLPADTNVHQSTRATIENGVLSFKLARIDLQLQPLTKTVDLEIN